MSYIITAKDVQKVYSCHINTAKNILANIRVSLSKNGKKKKRILLEEFCREEQVDEAIVRKELGLKSTT